MDRAALQSTLDAIRRDDREGATALARRAATAVMAWAREAPSLSGRDCRDLLHQIATLRPSMAPFLRFAEALARGAGTPAGRPSAAGLAAAAARFMAVLDASPARIAARACEVPPTDPRIATYSAGAAVRESLLALHRSGLPLRVTLSEARPAGEGRLLAESLARAGVRVRLLTDAALTAAVAHSGALWLGADALTPDGVVHKVGTAALCATAGRHGVEVRVLAGESKLLGRDLAALLRLEEGRPAAVYDGGVPGVEPGNPLFDRTPWTAIDNVVTESGLEPASALQARAASSPLPSELMAWLAGEDGPGACSAS